MKVLGVVLPILISVLLLGHLFYRSDWGSIGQAIGGADTSYLLLAVAVSLASNIALGALRWWRILTVMGLQLSFWDCLRIRSGCLPYELALPMKASELLKAVYLKRRQGINPLHTVSSLLLEKAYSLLLIVTACLVGLGFVSLNLPVLPVALGLLLPLVFLFWAPVRRFGLRAVGAIHPRLGETSVQLVEAFDASGPLHRLEQLGYSALFVASEFVNAWLIYRALGINLPVGTIIAVVPVVVLAGALPISVMGLGTREFLLVTLLASHGSYEWLLGGAVLLSAIERILPMVAGLPFVRLFTAGLLKKE